MGYYSSKKIYNGYLNLTIQHHILGHLQLEPVSVSLQKQVAANSIHDEQHCIFVLIPHHAMCGGRC